MLSTFTRMREHAGLFAAFLITAFLVSGLLAGASGLLGRQATDGVRADLSEHTGAARALRFSLPLAADPTTQDRDARDMVARAFSNLEASIAVDRTVQGVVPLAPVTAAGVLGARSVVAMSIPDLENRATLVAGAWPSGPRQVTVQAGAAAGIGIAPGDSVEIDGVRFDVVGTWMLADRLDPRTLGDPLLETGASTLDIGPVVIDESVWSDLKVVPVAQWTLIPDGPQFAVNDVSALPTDWRYMTRAWRGDPAGLQDLALSGGLLPTLVTLNATIAGLAAVQPLGVLLLAIVAIVTFAELARLLTTVRAAETTLLWSRGASTLTIAGRSVVDAAAVTIVGALLGLGSAWLMVTTLNTGTYSDGPLSGLGAGVATVAVAVVLVAVSAARSASRQTVRDPSRGAGRARQVAGSGLVVLVVMAATVSVWQLRLYGGSLTPTADGGVAVDPIAVLAPVLALVAVVLVALSLFPTLAALAERQGRNAGIRRLLALRNVARRPALAAAPLLLVAVAVAGLTTAAGYQATWASAFDVGSRLSTGGDIRVTSDFAIATDTVDALRAIDGVDSVAALDHAAIQLGADNGVLVSASPDAFAAVAATLPPSLGFAGVAEAFRASSPGPVLPAGTTGLQLTVSTHGLTADPALAIHLRDSGGITRVLALTHVPGTPSTYVLAVPEILSSVSPLQIVAIDVSIAPGTALDGLDDSFTLATLVATTAAGKVDLDLGNRWHAASPTPQVSTPTPTSDGHGFRFDAQSIGARLIAAPSPLDAVRAVISQKMAHDYRLGTGDHFTATLVTNGRQLFVIVAAVVPVIPSADAEPAILIDASALQPFALERDAAPDGPHSLWIASDHPDSVVGAIRPFLPANARVDTVTDPGARAVLAAAATSLWLAGGGCGILAIVGVAASGRALRRDRRDDIAVLRALGLSSRDQVAISRRELTMVSLTGVAVGVAAGVAALLLTVQPLARSAVPGVTDGIATPLLMDFAGWGFALAVLAVSLGTVIAILSGSVGVAARTARREESR
ncbi:MAG: FtsX-like permease family protein [Pseudolysinimonas sp.]|uniref:FtsX-like permease family protein n=1 Tax=Pseudolysinimonas sp. TaxID=2680009 RepID=UPI003267D655